MLMQSYTALESQDWLPMGPVLRLTTAVAKKELARVGYDINDFETDVIMRSHEVPVLVDFWAEWCGPCKVLGPILEKLAREHEDEWELAKVDTERHPAVAAQYGISSIPNVKLFRDGKVTEEFVGAMPEPQIIEWLRRAVPSKYHAQLEGARRLLFENRASDAEEMLQAVVTAEPHNDQAVVMLAEVQLGSDPKQAVRTVEAIELGSNHFEQAQAIRTLAKLFDHVAKLDSLPQDSVRDDYVSGIRRALSRDFNTALQGLVEVVRRNRNFDDDGPRKACLAIFSLLGDENEVTKKHRAALSSVLF
jgi:putative thioredoxin